MAVKLINDQQYKLKGTHEVVTIHQNSDGSFWYWEDLEKLKLRNVTADDIEDHAYISRGGQDEVEIGDIVVYLSGGYKSAVSTDIGQVIGYNNARVEVRFNNGKFGTSKLSPHNLLVVTESKLRKKYDWIK